MRALTVLALLICASPAFAQSESTADELSAPPVFAVDSQDDGPGIGGSGDVELTAQLNDAFPSDGGSDAENSTMATVVSLDTQRVVFEGDLPAQDLLIEVSPGHYELRRQGFPPEPLTLEVGDDLFIPGTRIRLQSSLLVKDRAFTEIPRTLRSVQLEHSLDLRAATGLGVNQRLSMQLAIALAVTIGLTDRLQWTVPLPYFTYLAGSPGSREWLIEGGVTNFGAQTGLVALGFGAGLSHRSYFTPTESFLVGINAGTDAYFGDFSEQLGSLKLWTGRAQFGYSRSFDRWLTINVGAALHIPVDLIRNRLTVLSSAPVSPLDSAVQMSLGSPLRIGYRPLPLAQLHVTERLSVDAYGTVTPWWQRSGLQLFWEVMGGFSWTP
ncbi:MAG: hypothetical protein ACJ790_01970 [Myxococcaceae bacterium]